MRRLARAVLAHTTCRGCGVSCIGTARDARYANHTWRCRAELARVGLIDPDAP